jgi:hypothetical protein
MKTRRDEVFNDALVELGSLHGQLTHLVDRLTDEKLDSEVVEHLKQMFLKNERTLIQLIGVIECSIRNIRKSVDQWTTTADRVDTTDHRH